MRKIVLALMLVVLVVTTNAQTTETATPQYEYKMFTTIESVVPGGLGRSRIISTDKDSQIQEKELENFFSLVGINFKNIQNNDVVIVGKINDLAKDGYEFYQAVPGVYSGGEKGNGIFITRYIFRKIVKK